MAKQTATKHMPEQAVPAAPPEPRRPLPFLPRVATLESLQYRDYRWLWLSTFTSFMAMMMLMITRGWLVLTLENDSPLALSLVMASFAAPIIFVSLIGGALADRLSRKRMMVLASFGSAIFTLAVATLDLTGLIAFWHLLVTGVLNGTMMAFNMPSRQAIISDIVPEDKLMNAIALSNSGMNLTRILGPAVAGVLIVYIGTHGVFYLIVGMYILSALALLTIDAGKTGKARSGNSMAGDIKEGLAYAAHNPTLKALIVMVFIPVLFGMSYYALLPSWAREALDAQSDSLGMLMMMMGVGALIGTLLLASLRNFRRRGALLLVCCVAWGAALAVFSQSTSYTVAIPMLLLIGLVSSVFMALNMSLLQLSASPEMRGRVMSIAMMSFGVFPLSSVPFGIIAERVGTPDALLLSGLLLVAFTVAFIFVYPRFRRIP